MRIACTPACPNTLTLTHGECVGVSLKQNAMMTGGLCDINKPIFQSSDRLGWAAANSECAMILEGLI